MAQKNAELLHGFTNLNDIVNERVVGDRIAVVRTAIEDTVKVHNETLARMLALFVKSTTEFQIRYKSPAAARLMGLDEAGRARKVNLAGYYDVAFPLKAAGLAVGDTRIAKIKQTVQDVNDRLTVLLGADNAWLRDNILAALLTKEQYTVTDEEHGDLTIKGLANGDSTKYLIRPGSMDGQTADHFLTVPAIDNANAGIFKTIYRMLTGAPENKSGGQIITFVHSDQSDEIEALDGFLEKEDADVRPSLTERILVGTLNVNVPGEIMGKVGRNWIVRWDGVPSSYMLSVTTQGDRPLAMREHAEPELQGFTRWAEREDAPFSEEQYDRHAGFGGFNRVGAIATRVAPSVPGTYESPASLKQPLD